MKDIKERVRDKNPKIRNPAARLPKELVRSAVLEAKEKPRELHEKSSGQSESPTQYGTEKIESVQYRAASVAGKSIGKTTYQGGKKLAGVTYRKIKERKSRQEEAKAAEEAMEQGAERQDTEPSPAFLYLSLQVRFSFLAWLFFWMSLSFFLMKGIHSRYQ